jgi:hypothetical protein
LLAFAIPMMVIAPLTHSFVQRLGAKVVVATGLTLFISGLLLATGLNEFADYGDMVWRIVIMASGMALIMAPATDSIMGSLPLARAGVGSAVNDTTRQVGGAVGVAVVGSVYASIYAAKVVDGLSAKGANPALISAAKESIGAGLAAAVRAGGSFVSVVKSSFVDGFHAGLFVGAGVLVVALAAVVLWLPARARAEDVDAQHAEHEAARASVGAAL